jgi:hypothetical protein
MLQASLPASVRLTAEYNAPLDRILAHPAQIQQLLLNLCRNAVQAMPGGGELIVGLANMRVASAKTAPHPSLAPGDYVVVRVTDTGSASSRTRWSASSSPSTPRKKTPGARAWGWPWSTPSPPVAAGRSGRPAPRGWGPPSPSTCPWSSRPARDRGRTGRVRPQDRPPAACGRRQGALAAMARVLRGEGFTVRAADSAERGSRPISRTRRVRPDPGRPVHARTQRHGDAGAHSGPGPPGQGGHRHRPRGARPGEKGPRSGRQGLFPEAHVPPALVDDIRRLLGEENGAWPGY